MNSSISSIYNRGKVVTPIENKLSFQTDELDLHLFETKVKTSGFALAFDEISLITMLSGKKVMHFNREDSFEFLPEESLVLDKKQGMNIDFPEAEYDNPTRCLALIISPDEIKETLMQLNESAPKIDHTEWTVDSSTLKFTNNQLLNNNIERIIMLASSNSEYRDALGKLMTKELIINLLQSKARDFLLEKTDSLAGNNQLAFAIEYIRKNQDRQLTVEEVAEKAHMSKSTFYRYFKRHTGSTPNEFILSEKIKQAKYLLANTSQSVSEIGFALAFASSSQFIKHFKSITGLTPFKFKQSSDALLR